MNRLPRNIKDFWLYYWRYDPKRWLLFLMQDIIHFSRYQISFIFIGMGVDVLISSDPADGIPSAVWLPVLAVLLTLGFGESMHVWTAYIIRKWLPGLRRRIRSDFFNYALGHSHAYYQDHFAGSLARKITEIAEASVRLHNHVRFAIFGSIVGMVSATLTMFFVSPLYAGLMLLFIASLVIPVLMRLKRIAGRSRHFSEARAQASGAVVDILTNVSSMRNFANVRYEESMHTHEAMLEQKADSKRLLTLIQVENWRRLSLVGLSFIMFVALVLGWRAGIVSVGEISTIMGQTMMMVGAAWMFSMGIVMSADELGYIDDALRIITPDHGVPDRKGVPDLDVREGRISFENVGFEYTGQPVFDNLDIEIAPGEKVGLMGPSGAGKSTFVSILLRLFDVQRGNIQIDGQDISVVRQESLRDHIAVIPQDTSLFHRSLADNIRYGRLDATDDEVIEAAKKAHAHEFIDALPEGYETLVGERGIKLSGGQRQRIAIARAILKDAPILVLDEATSALDSESEKLIQESLAELMEGKTVIAIAHRLSTISHLDRMIVMNDGQILEDGNHDSLIKKGGLYARLWSMQSGGYIGDDCEEEAA